MEVGKQACLRPFLVGAKAGLSLPGDLHGIVKTTLNEKDYLDNSGHRPAMRRMRLNDKDHLSAATRLSCREGCWQSVLCSQGVF